MSQRAAWQLERLGFLHVHDFVLGKVHWLASGRPTVRADGPARVGEQLTDAATALLDDTVSDVASRLDGLKDSIVVIDANAIVYGQVRRKDLDAAQGSELMADIMGLGPTTIRPNEESAAVRGRMARRSVKALIVSNTTGQLLGEFGATEALGRPSRPPSET